MYLYIQLTNFHTSNFDLTKIGDIDGQALVLGEFDWIQYTMTDHMHGLTASLATDLEEYCISDNLMGISFMVNSNLVHDVTNKSLTTQC